jgi:hypothetical protein
MKKQIKIKLVFVKKLKPQKEQKLSEVTPEDNEEWLDNLEVMEFLNIRRRTFFEQAGKGDWIVQMRGNRKFYLKSSLIKSQ